MKRRSFLKSLPAAAAFSPIAAPAVLAQKAAAKTLRIIHSTNLASLDPIWTTEAGTKAYAFMTYDQLVAVDANDAPQPQMVEGWSIEDDGRSYVFGLREGLKFHDGEPVRSQDCIPSIRRWGARDGFGQMTMRFVDTMDVIDDRKFRVRLKKPFRLLPDALGKASSALCVMMPERVASTDPMKQITECVGSGPYRFLRDEWVSGAHAAWARFEDYIPRKEPVSGIAGGRIPACDRVEWSIITDAATALAALQAGEQDIWDQVPNDLIAVLKTDPDIVLQIRNSAGAYTMLQFNHLQPPFNSLAIRQAVAMAIDQVEILRAAISDPVAAQPCYSYYPCGTLYASEAGADILKVKSVDKAKAALKTAGYAGEKVVLLGSTTLPATWNMTQVIQDVLRRIGMNVELQPMDSATLAQRRTSREPVEKGGWSAFVTAWTGTDILYPGGNQMLRAGGTASGWWGWADDPEIESLRDQWASATSPDEQLRLATAIQVEAFKVLPYIPLGRSTTQTAYHKNVTGVFPAPTPVYWNIGKA